MSTLPEALPEPDPIAIAQRLRMYMGDKKLSRAQLAVGSGINRTSLGAKLDGDGRFTLDELLAIGRALGRSWLWVMTGVDAPAPNPPEGVSDGAGARNDLLRKRRARSGQPPGEVDDRKHAA